MKRTNVQRTVGSHAAILGLLLAALLALSASPAYARDFTVLNTNDSGSGSLRRVIDLANLTPGADTIKFAIPGEGVKTISPASGLPPITEAVTIDGYTQRGSSPNTAATGTNARLTVELDGSEEISSFADGLDISASNVVVRGLAINGFGNNGVSIASGSGIRIEGNFIGTDPSGTLDLGNRLSGVAIFGSGNIVGGTSLDRRNLISGNDGFGVGISTFATPGGNKVEGNLIGTKKNGSSALKNSASGVDLRSAGNTIGGAAASAANTIAFNGGDGVAVAIGGSTGNRILTNSIFANVGLGIDLLGGIEGATGATQNDAGDADTGPNNLQNKPVLTSAKTSVSTFVQGTLNSVPNTVFQVQFFSSPSGNQGKKVVGIDSLTTDANGNATFNSPVRKVAGGQRITATAIDFVSGNTSEFSAPVTVVAQ